MVKSKNIDVKRIGIASDLPARFTEVVKSQLGADYDIFVKLDEICKPAAGAASKEYKEIYKI